MENNNNKKNDWIKIQNIYFIASLILFGLGFALFGLGYLLSRNPRPVGEEFFEAIRMLYIYHVPHFFIGIALFIVLRKKIKNGLVARTIKTIVSVLFTPVSWMIYLAALILIGFSGCSS